jgi:hypothetical protein
MRVDIFLKAKLIEIEFTYITYIAGNHEFLGF